MQRLFILAALALILAACNLNRSDSEPTATRVPDPNSAETPTDQTEDRILIYLIALEDNGASGEMIGCNDSLIPVERVIGLPDRVDAQISAALNELFSIRDQYYGESGLYNSLYQSKLTVDSVTIDEAGQATVNLAGTHSLSGVCDNPRFQAQIERTVGQFEGVTSVAVFINGTSLADIVSGQ